MVAENNEQAKVLTPAEVARELRCSVSLVYRQLRQGTIPHVKIGDLYLIPKAAFEGWLLRCQEPAKIDPKSTTGSGYSTPTSEV